MREVIRYLDENRAQHLDQLREFLSIPSVSTRSEHSADIRRAAAFVAQQLEAAELEEVTVHDTAGHPCVTARTPLVPGAPTVLVYGHYDVQPAEPLELWDSAPFDPQVRGHSLYARGASDDKGQVFIYLKVLEAFRRTRGAVPINVKLLIEGEEEIGSPSLVSFVEKHKKALACDFVLVSDTHMLGLRQPSITVGLRGLAGFEITARTAKADMHSGTYGGGVANPIQVLCELLVACKHPKTGKVTIPGFYERVRRLTPGDRRAIAAAPHDDEKLRRAVGAPALFGERGFTTLERLGARPTFEINGIWGGYTAEGVKTVLPATAHAKVTMRLVPDQRPKEVLRCVEAHLKAIAPPHVKLTIKREDNEGSPSFVDPELPAMRVVAGAVERVFGKAPAFTLEGGSIPIVADFKRVLKRDTILLGFGLPDDNLHAPNEKLDLRMLDRGMKTVAHVFDRLPGS